MDFIRAFLVIAVVGGGLLVGPLSAQPSFTVRGGGYSGGEGHVNRTQLSARMAQTGDTLFVRHVLQNVSDADIEVRALECGVRLHGDLEIRHLTGPETCDTETRSLAPGDTLWAESAYEILSGPGQYRLTLRHAKLARFDGPPDTGGFSFTVMTTEEAERFAGALRGRGLPLVTIPFVLDFSATEASDVAEQDISIAITTALMRRGYTPVEMAPIAARRLLPRPHLLVRLAAGDPGRYERSMGWVWQDDEESAPAFGPCKRGPSSGTTPLVALGVDLAFELNQLLDRYESGACPPPGD